jgi:hypothetical protein
MTLALAVAGSLAWSTPVRAQTRADVKLWDTTWVTYKALEAKLPADYLRLTPADLVVVINAPLLDVFDIYSNVNNALGIHPFLASITPIRHTGTVYDFIAYENIPLPDGTIYPGVTVSQQRFHRSQHYYEADTYDVPGIVTHQHISFKIIGCNVTQVTEHLSFDAPPAYAQTSVEGGVYAHMVVQAGLKAKIEAGLLKPIRFPFWLEPHGSHHCSHDDEDRDND